MIVLKVVSQLLLLSLPLGPMVRGHRWPNRETDAYRRATACILVHWIVAAGLAVLVWVGDAHQAQTQAARLDDLAAGSDTLLVRNERLIKEIAAYQGQLMIEKARVSQLEGAVEVAAAGVSTGYDFQGVIHSTGPGFIQVHQGPEAEAFPRMVQLHDEGRWQELTRLCEEWIGRSPAWLTPYALAGVAYANTDAVPLAIERLEYVRLHAGADPDYDQAEILLEILKRR